MILRLPACLGSLFLAAAWWLHDRTDPQAIVGGLAFAGLAASFLVPGLWRGFWVELLAVLGALLMLMAGEALMIGFALTVPALFLLVARQWRIFQLSVEAGP